MKNVHFERRLLTVIEANTNDLTARQQDRIIGAVRQELSLLDSEAVGAAISMRDLCVDAIKSLRATPRGAAYNNAVNDAIHKIQSLTLEQEQK